MSLAQDVGWLVNGFVERTPKVTQAAVVSADGLLLAASSRLPRAAGDQLAAICSGLGSLTAGAARCFNGGDVQQVIVEMSAGYLFVTSISDGSLFAVLAEASCDLGMVGYEMALLVRRVGEVLTPALRAELQAALPR